MSKHWVQHISGQGEKWELHPEYTRANSFEKGTSFTVVNKDPFSPELRLPRSEYRLCPAPEVWKDVNKEKLCEARQAINDLKKTVSTLEIALSGLVQ